MLGSDHENSVKRQMLDKVRMNASAFPVLAQISGVFARNAADCVREYLHCLTETVGANFSVKRYGNFVDSIPMPAMIGVLANASQKKRAAVSLDNRFTNIITDLAMGGDMPDLDALEGRAPTSLDSALAKPLVDRLVAMFDHVVVNACGRSIGLMTCERFEQVPILLDIAPERSELISFQVAFEIGEVAEPASLELVLPIEMLEPVRAQLQHSSAPMLEPERLNWTRHMSKVVARTPIVFDAEIARTVVRLQSLMEMTEGDVFPLGDATLDEVALIVDAGEGPARIASGKLGSARGMKAIRLNAGVDPAFIAPFLNRKVEPLGDA